MIICYLNFYLKMYNKRMIELFIFVYILKTVYIKLYKNVVLNNFIFI